VRISVSLPLRSIPDLQAVRDADDGDFSPQMGVVPQRTRQDQPSLRVEFRSIGVAEEHPGVRPVRGFGDWEGLDLLLAALPLGSRKCEQAAVLTECQVNAFLERASELRRKGDATLGIDLIVVLTEELRHVGALPPPPLCPTFMPLLLHPVKVVKRITVM
jgi:hypothetical protein